MTPLDWLGCKTAKQTNKLDFLQYQNGLSDSKDPSRGTSNEYPQITFVWTKLENLNNFVYRGAMIPCLTFNTLLAYSADHKLMIFFSYFSQKTGFDISCKLSPLGTICMKCQSLFSVENKNFFPETGFELSCKLSPLVTICKKYQNLFSGKNKKNICISICRLLKPRVL